MGEETDRLIAAVRGFIAAIEHFRIERALIFGSRVRGDWLVGSDLDLILVSRDFSGVRFGHRIAEVQRYRIHWNEPFSLDLICYTPEEFERKSKQIGMVQDAVNEGILLDLRPSRERV